MGRVLLAGLPDEEVLRRLRAARPKARTRHTVTDIDTLLTRVQQARRQGWSLVNQELEEGLISLAAPIVDRSGHMIAALNLSGQANRTSAKVAQETLLPALLRAARAISQRPG
jgi:IclR family pca regulon transcriptional regulator